MHKLGLSPVHMEAKLFCLLTIQHQGVPQQTVRCAEQDGIVSVLQVGHLVFAMGHSGYSFTDPAHQVVDYAVEQVWGAGDGKPVRVSAIDKDTALHVVVKQLEEGGDLWRCAESLHDIP